jgi:hypothetical protein
MYNKHDRYDCTLYAKMINTRGEGNLSAVVPSAVSKLKENNVSYEVFPVQAQRNKGSKHVDVYLTANSAALIANNYKGKCLSFLLSKYAGNSEFAASLDTIRNDSEMAAVEYCTDIWMEEKMEPDKGEIRRALIQFAQMTELPFQEAIYEFEKYKIEKGPNAGKVAVSADHCHLMREAIRTILRAVDGTSQRLNSPVRNRVTRY